MESKFQEKNNVIRNKSFDFSIIIVNLYKVLYHERNEKTLSQQLLRSGTSIGANIEEGIAPFSKKEFIYKLQISYKEAYQSFIGINFYIKQNSLMIQNLIL